MKTTLTASLAGFTRDLRYEDIPVQGIERARTAIIDCIGCILAGSVEPPARIVSSWISREGGQPRATLIGQGYRSSASAAALANGTAGHAQDYDDVSPPMIGHPSVPLVPALLAAAEVANASGAQVIAAYVIGLDVAARLGRLMNPEHYAYGWHATSTLGALAAAAGSARLLNLTDEQTRYALGIAASGAGGLRKNFGSMVKPLHAGQAAQRGLAAAFLAAGGFDADPDILDGQHGFLDVFRGQATLARDASSIRFALDQPLEIVESGVGIKQYACCGCVHTALDVVRALMSQNGFTAADVQEVECGVNKLAPEVLIHHDAQTGLQGKFSMEYSVAVALLDGKAGPQQFEDEHVQRDDVRDLQRRIHMKVDRDLPVRHGLFPAKITIRLRSGAQLHGEAHKAIGMHPSLPLADEEIDAKFRACAAYALDTGDAETVLKSLRVLERLPDLKALMSLLLGKGARDES